jgi:hypothetical protein
MRCSRPAAPRATRAISAIAAPYDSRTGRAFAGPRFSRVSRAWVRCGVLAVGVAVVTTMAAGCGSNNGGGPSHLAAVPSATPLAPPRATCGTSHTAVNVPVLIEIEKGSTSCQVAMQIQDGYTGLVKAGRVSGNGGGSPVQVDGWTCQGTDTTTTVQTGEASECHKGTTEIVAVLKLQSGSGSGG